MLTPIGGSSSDSVSSSTSSWVWDDGAAFRLETRVGDSDGLSFLFVAGVWGSPARVWDVFIVAIKK
jgi:hypothetical protein